jgi:hypothetical protein
MAMSRCSLGLHRWAYARQRADDPSGFVVCRDCGRRRSSGLRISMVLFAAFFIGGIAVFALWSPLLGALMIIGAIGGSGWSMLTALFDRVTRWLTIGR